MLLTGTVFDCLSDFLTNPKILPLIIDFMSVLSSMLCKVMSNSEGVSGLALDIVDSPAKYEICIREYVRVMDSCHWKKLEH